MLDIDTIIIQNFMSYGDTPTTVKLCDLGPCLITGGVINEIGEEDNDGSNRCGKSTLVNAILWCIFGKTMHSENPGDRVVNWFNKSGCRVELILKNGDRIIRTRSGKDGHDDLLYIKNGEDISLGTNKMQQEELNRIFNLDYVLFCGSSFFKQYAKPWLEMSAPARKNALEREFRIDRMQLYADIAKEKSKNAEDEQFKIRTQVNGNQITIRGINNQIEEMTSASNNFASAKARRLEEANATLKRLEENRDSIQMVDIDEVKNKWSLINKANELLTKKQQDIYKLESKRRDIANDISYNNKRISSWTGKIGVCPTCEREITKDYIGTKIESPTKANEELQRQLAEIDTRISNEQTRLDTIRKQLEAKKPEITISEATARQNEWNRWDRSAKNQQQTIKTIEAEENKYDQTIAKLREKAAAIQADIDKLLGQLKELDRTILHWNYIYKAYSDRRKIKAQVLCDYIPYLNERIKYYLDRLGMELQIEFTEGMGIKSNCWDYDFFCGGERKRVDIAMMLAMFDLHTVMYSRQCNIMVLDEVDGRLDRRGAQCLIDIVKTDLAGKTDAILVISHRTDMRGAFPSEIKVIKQDNISRIKEISR